MALLRCVWTTEKEKHQDIVLQKTLETVERAGMKIDLHPLSEELLDEIVGSGKTKEKRGITPPVSG